MQSIGDVLSYDEAKVCSCKDVWKFLEEADIGRDGLDGNQDNDDNNNTNNDDIVTDTKDNIDDDHIFFQEMVGEADVDGDGNVNYEEFVGMLFKLVSFQKLH